MQPTWIEVLIFNLLAITTSLVEADAEWVDISWYPEVIMSILPIANAAVASRGSTSSKPRLLTPGVEQDVDGRHIDIGLAGIGAWVGDVTGSEEALHNQRQPTLVKCLERPRKGLERRYHTARDL